MNGIYSFLGSSVSIVYNGSKWALSGAYQGTQWAVSGLSTSALQGISKVATHIWESPKAQNAREKVQSVSEKTAKTLLKTPPAALKNLDEQLALIQNPSDPLSIAEVQKLNQAIAPLSANNSQLLRQLAPDLSNEDLEACNSFFQMVQNIVEDPSFAIAASDPHLEDLEDQVLQPLTLEEGRTRLNAFSSIVHKITAGNSGYVVRVADNGLLTHKRAIGTGLIFAAGTYLLTGSPTTALAASGLGGLIPSVSAEPSKAIEKAKALVFCSPLLSESRKQVRELQRALRDNNPKKAAEFAADLKPLIKDVSRNPKATFTRPLASKDAKHLHNLKSVLDGWNGTDPLPIEQLKKPVDQALVVLNRKYREQRGPVEAVADTFKTSAEEVIEKPLKRFEVLTETVKSFVTTAPTLLQSSIYNFLGWDAEEAPNPPVAPPNPALSVPPLNPAHPAAPPVPPANRVNPVAPIIPEPGAGSEDNFLIQFLEWAASNIAKLIGEKNAGKISEKTLSAAAGFIALILNKVVTTMDPSSEGYQTVKDRVTALISAINQSATNRDWKTVLRVLQDAPSSLFKNVKAYFGNIQIPGTGAASESETNADIALSDNISALNEAIATPEPESENLDWKALAIEEKDRLVSNAASSLAMKYIWENVCGLQPPNAKFYPDLLAAATDTETLADGKERKVLSETRLKELFFEQLTANKVGVIKRIFAEFQYWLYANTVKFFTQKATTIYFEEIFKYIEDNSEDNFSFLRGMIINNLTRYLTILGGAYNTVANTPSATGLMSEMLMKELEKKESNQGFETAELYRDFAKIVLEKTNGTVFAWFISKFLGNPEEIVRSVIDLSSGSLVATNQYTLALNTVTGDLLDKVWKLLQDSTKPASEGGDPKALPELSEGQKNQLSILTKNLFDVLRKSKCSTVDELRNLIQGKLLREHINKAADSLFIQDVIEHTTRILAATVELLIEGKQLEKLTYTFAKLVNQTFEVAEEVTPEQIKKAEEKVAKRSEQILRFAVNSAVKERLDFSGKSQQNETNSFIEQLHTLSTQHFDAASANLKTLKTIDVTTLEARNKINQLIETTKAYKETCQDIHSQVKAAKLNSDNKEEIHKRNLDLAQASKPFIEDVKQLKNHSRILEQLQKAIPRLQKIGTIVGDIGKRLYDQKTYANKEDIEFAENQIVEFDSLIAELKTIGIVEKNFIDLLTYQQKRLEKILIVQRHALSVRQLRSELGQPGSLLELIVQERKIQVEHHLGKPGSPENMNLIRQKLMVVRNEALLPQLHQQLKAMEDAALSYQVDNAKSEFMRLLSWAAEEANQKILPGRDEHWDCSQKIYGILNDTGLLKPQKVKDTQRAIQQSAAAAHEHLEKLKTWEKDNYKKLVYGNFSLGATTRWLQGGISEMGTNLVYERVKERQKGIWDMLQREETYRYGILHHSFLIPYVQRAKKRVK